MIRRLLVPSFRRVFLLFLLVCLGCSAQLAPTELTQRIERQLPASYSVPPTVKVIISSLHPSEFPNYDAVTVTFDADGKKQNFDFLISKVPKTLVRLTKTGSPHDPSPPSMIKTH